MPDLAKGTAIITPTEGYSTQDYEQAKFVVNDGTVSVRTTAVIGDIEIGSVELKDGATDTRATVSAAGLFTSPAMGIAVALTTPAANLTAGADTTFTFSSEIRHLLAQNNTVTDFNINFGAAATAGNLLVKAGQILTMDIPVTAVHILSAAASPVNGSAGSNVVLLGWA